MAVKRLLGTCAAIVLTAGLVAGCGKAGTAPKEAQTPSAEEESVDAEAEAAEEKGEDAAAAEADSAGQEADAKEEEPAAAKQEVFPETVLMDRDGVKVTVEGFGLGEYGDKTITATVTNNTSANVETTAIEIIADGNIIMAQGRVDAPAGQTVSGEYELRSYDLINAGIVSIHEMSMRMHIDGDDLGDSSGYTDTVSVVTDTESVATERDMSLFQELYNEDGIVALVESTARKNEIGDFEYLILFENNTDDTLLLEPILHLASGDTRVGYNKIPPHAKISISNGAHEGDTCLVRVSLVHGEHDHEKLFETDEVAIQLP
jgi:hypothetical protein